MMLTINVNLASNNYERGNKTSKKAALKEDIKHVLEELLDIEEEELF